MTSHLQYNDPLFIEFRRGTEDDPYIDRTDSLPVINNQITLLEIPSSHYKVRIAGLTEVSQEVFERKRELLPHEFLVNYQVGNIQFHPSQEGKTFLCNYKGRGLIMYPASRIYAMIQNNPEVIKNLQEIIEEASKRLKDSENSVNHLLQVIEEAMNATINANQATDNATKATQDAKIATQEAVEAAASTIMIYKEPVPTYDDLTRIYPNPDNGWRVMIEDTGEIYRYDGIQGNKWKLIDNYTGNSIPFASETSNGLLKRDDYVNFVVRSVVFVVPFMPESGVQNFLIQFPFDGEIIKAYAFCNKPGIVRPLELQIEKISKEKFALNNIWEGIFSRNIFIYPNERLGSEPSFKIKTVKKGDYFRLNAIQLDNNIKGVTVQIDIKIKNEI